MDEQPVETTLYSLDDKTPEPGGQWSAERHLSLLRVGSLMIGERRELCLIKSISAGGMLIRAYCRIEPGTRLTIELKQGEPVTATARWARDDCIGASFDSPIDVLGLISASLDGPRPRMPRIELHCTAWVREGASVHRTKAVDVSQGGVKILSARELPSGEEVVVTLTGLAPIPAVIQWKDGNSYGLTFHRSLALTTLVGWLQEQHQREQSRAVG
ncbi:MAG TPA: PilZ domain-containing protein [Sphingomicrobium sp.]